MAFNGRVIEEIARKGYKISGLPARSWQDDLHGFFPFTGTLEKP